MASFFPSIFRLLSFMYFGNQLPSGRISKRWGSAGGAKRPRVNQNDVIRNGACHYFVASLDQGCGVSIKPHRAEWLVTRRWAGDVCYR